MHRIHHIVAVALTSTSFGSVTWAKPPEVFSTKSVTEARQEAKDAGKLFLIDATAVWCPPCRQMDKTTWVDEEVVSWLRENAVAAQLDVDKQKGAAMGLKISAMPTVIVFKEDAEFDRVVGYRSADELLTWLNGTKEGKRDIDRVREAAGDRADPDGDVDVQARYQLARGLMRDGQLDDATQEYLWLWDHMLEHEPAMAGVRLSFMISDMKGLARKHVRANEAFTRLRDRYQAAIDDGTADREQFTDWSHLNEVIGDDDAVIVWFDRVKDNPEKAQVIQSAGDELFDALIEHDRWADAGTLLKDPVGDARTRVFGLQVIRDREVGDIDDERRASTVEVMERLAREECSQQYAACLAAGRDRSAESIASILIEALDDYQTRFALVETALRAKQPREQHRIWLDEADAMGERNDRLRKTLDKALAAQE
jgi:thioredoxin 1